MRHHEGRGQNLETEDALDGRFLQILREQGVAALLAQRLGDPVEHRNQIRAGAATRVQHIDVGVGEAIGQRQFLAENAVHALHHVVHNLGGGVPDAEVLAQFGVEGLQKRLVEILHGVALFEGIEELAALYAVQGGGGPVQHLVEVHGFHRTGVGHFAEELAQDGNAQVLVAEPPIEARGAAGVRLAPQHPGGEHAVKQRLDQGGAKKMIALGALEGHAERFLERRADGGESRVLAMLDAELGFVRVGGEKHSQVGRGIEGRG